MADGELPIAPLAPFKGARPPAPDWYKAALDERPQTLRVDVGGAGVEALTWGERGRPGMILLHGAGGHAGWWRHIAPYLAQDYRVAAFSLSGMGGSDWRDRYDFDAYADEVFAVAEAAGLYETLEKPIVAAHSFGGRVALRCAARDGERLKAAVIVDTILRPPGAPPVGKGLWEARPTKVYPTLEAALARFRLAPLQPCENLFLVDAIARESLGPPRDGSEGWTWKFDPMLWAHLDAGRGAVHDLLEAKAPTALVFAERSRVMRPEQVAEIARLVPGVPLAILPDAEHHVMLDQPMALIAMLRGLLAGWPRP